MVRAISSRKHSVANAVWLDPTDRQNCTEHRQIHGVQLDAHDSECRRAGWLAPSTDDESMPLRTIIISSDVPFASDWPTTRWRHATMRLFSSRPATSECTYIGR